MQQIQTETYMASLKPWPGQGRTSHSTSPLSDQSPLPSIVKQTRFPHMVVFIVPSSLLPSPLLHTTGWFRSPPYFSFSPSPFFHFRFYLLSAVRDPGDLQRTAGQLFLFNNTLFGLFGLSLSTHTLSYILFLALFSLKSLVVGNSVYKECVVGKRVLETNNEYFMSVLVRYHTSQRQLTPAFPLEHLIAARHLSVSFKQSTLDSLEIKKHPVDS